MVLKSCQDEEKAKLAPRCPYHVTTEMQQLAHEQPKLKFFKGMRMHQIRLDQATAIELWKRQVRWRCPVPGCLRVDVTYAQ